VKDVVVCWKWLGERAPTQVGVSHADEAALALARHLTGDTGSVTVLLSGPPGADAAAREALARGATSAGRLDGAGDEPSRDVAGALARAIAEDHDVDLIVCGDASFDRGSGSVPAFVAAQLDWPQALGLLELAPTPDGALTATRRLDQGRREQLVIRGRAVVSVEPGVARPQRASLVALRAARTASIQVRPGPPPLAEPPGERVPFRPRARVVAAPSGEDALTRVRDLADSDTAAHATDTAELDPSSAAARIVELLAQWGYRKGGRRGP